MPRWDGPTRNRCAALTLSADQDGLAAWLGGHIGRVAAHGGRDALQPPVRVFPELIDADPGMGRYRTRIIEQVLATWAPASPD